MLNQLSPSVRAALWCCVLLWTAPTVTTVPAMGLLWKIQISSGKHNCGSIYPRGLLSGFWLGSILPLSCFAYSPNLYAGIFLPVFSFFKSVSFTSPFKNKHNGTSWQTGIVESPWFIKIWDSVICYLNSIYCVLQHFTKHSQANNIQKKKKRKEKKSWMLH